MVDLYGGYINVSVTKVFYIILTHKQITFENNLRTLWPVEPLGWHLQISALIHQVLLQGFVFVYLFYYNAKYDLCMHINTLNAVTHINRGLVQSSDDILVYCTRVSMSFSDGGELARTARQRHQPAPAPRAIVIAQQQRLLPEYIDTTANRAIYCTVCTSVTLTFNICMSPSKSRGLPISNIYF